MTAGVAAAFAMSSAAQSQPAIDGFVAKISDSLRAIHAQADGNATRILVGCRDLLGRVLNLEAMAQAASEDAWNRMSTAQHAAYRDAFAGRLAIECARELADYKGDAIALAGVRTTPDGDKLATLRVGAADDARMIAWRLRATDEQYSAVDVIWEGHSAIAKARDEFAAVLQGANGNIDALIEAMRK